MALFEYQQDVQRLIRDTKAEQILPSTLTSYINMARREIAMKTSCLRLLTPISGSVISASVVAAGSGYTAPVLTVSPPDVPSGVMPFPNGALAVLSPTLGGGGGGSIVTVNVSYGGNGYWQPSVVVTDPTGVGASVSLVTKGANQIVQGQERVNFSDIDLTPFPGYGAIYSVRSVTLLYSNYRYSLPIYSLSTYQAKIRQYTTGYRDVPSAGCQVGQGSAGYFLLYPIPSQPFLIQFDASCMPSDLLQDPDVEAIPFPWSEAVKWYTAFLVYTDLQNLNAARGMLALFDRHLSTHSAAAAPGRAINPYGRF